MLLRAEHEFLGGRPCIVREAHRAVMTVVLLLRSSSCEASYSWILSESFVEAFVCLLIVPSTSSDALPCGSLDRVLDSSNRWPPHLLTRAQLLRGGILETLRKLSILQKARRRDVVRLVLPGQKSGRCAENLQDLPHRDDEASDGRNQLQSLRAPRRPRRRKKVQRDAALRELRSSCAMGTRV